MKLGRMAHKLRLSSGSIILLKKGTVMAEPETINNLVDTISKTSVSNVILIVVDDFDDIRVMDEKQMNAHGWFRAETLRNLIHADPAKHNGHDRPSDADDDGDDVEIEV